VAGDHHCEAGYVEQESRKEWLDQPASPVVKADQRVVRNLPPKDPSKQLRVDEQDAHAFSCYLLSRATSSADRGTRLKHQGHPVTEYYQAVSCQYSVSMAWSPSVFTSESLLCAKLRQDVRSKRLDRSVRAILQSRSLYISHAGRPSAWSWPRCSIYPSC
jgi:hypothetical protein